MKLDRFRAPALAATAVLMISGVGMALASSPTAPSAPSAPAVEPVAPDTDLLQEGDQTTPDAATGAAAVNAAVAPAVAPVVAPAAETASPETGTEATTPETGTEAPETGVSDGPGGHEDPAGANVDHQFNGQE